jgi:hypothetical protein
MEGGPHIAETEAVPPAPDLLEAYADTEVSMFGFTGTFKDLAQMCPVDLNDARVTLEMKNDFIVKAANAAELAIQSEHEEVFARTAERLGLERKFTVAEPARNLRIEDIATNQALSNRREEMATKLAQKPEIVPASTLRKEADIMPIAVQAEQHLIALEKAAHVAAAPIVAASELTKAKAAPVRKPVQAVVRPAAVEGPIVLRPPSHEPARPITPHGESLLTRIIHTAHATTESVNVESEGAMSFVDSDVEHGDNETVTRGVTLPGAIHGLFDGFRDLVRHEPESSPVAAVEVVSTPADWVAELAKEPLVLYEDFTEALSHFVGLSSADSTETSGDVSGSGREDNEVPLFIAAVVAGRLTELETEEKLAVAPILQEIIGVIHAVEMSELAAADPEAIAALKLKLDELCVELFEVLGVAYTTEDIDQLMRIMMHDDFSPLGDETEQLNVEHEGTREVRLRLSAATGGLVDDARQELKQILGMFALRMRSVRDQYEIAA